MPLPEQPASEACGPEATYALKDGDCRWPYGHPASPEFRYCGRQAVPGTSYCAAHLATAWLHPGEAVAS